MIQVTFNTVIYMMLARFMLNDMPHAAGLFEYDVKPLTEKLTKFYHATPWSTWEQHVSKEGLKPQPLSRWRPGDTREGVYLGTTKEATVYFVEASWYLPLELMMLPEEEKAFMEAQEDFALLEVYTLKDLYLMPDTGFILSDGSYGAYISLRSIPRENIQLAGRIVPSIERGRVWEDVLP